MLRWIRRHRSDRLGAVSDDEDRRPAVHATPDDEDPRPAVQVTPDDEDRRPAVHATPDDEDPRPAVQVTPDDGTPAGDTAEVHSEISPHDLPLDHPGRHIVEEHAGPAGTMSADEEGRFRRGRDRTEERTGEPQRSAEQGKSTIGRSGGLPDHEDVPRTGRPGAEDRPGQSFPL